MEIIPPPPMNCCDYCTWGSVRHMSLKDVSNEVVLPDIEPLPIPYEVVDEN